MAGGGLLTCLPDPRACRVPPRKRAGFPVSMILLMLLMILRVVTIRYWPTCQLTVCLGGGQAGQGNKCLTSADYIRRPHHHQQARLHHCPLHTVVGFACLPLLWPQTLLPPCFHLSLFAYLMCFLGTNGCLLANITARVLLRETQLSFHLPPETSFLLSWGVFY